MMAQESGRCAHGGRANFFDLLELKALWVRLRKREEGEKKGVCVCVCMRVEGRAVTLSH